MRSIIASFIAIILLSGAGIYLDHKDWKIEQKKKTEVLEQAKDTIITKMTVTIGQRHTEAFKIPERPYTFDNVNSVFMRLEDMSKEYCDGRKSLNPSLKKYNWIVASLMTGCENFYLMNDLDAWKSFNVLGKLLKDQTKDCYTVGFSQLYLMSSYSKCTRISAIDIDWKILQSHHSLIFNFHGKKYDEDFFRNIRTYPDKNYGIRTFCESNDIASCRAAFKDFTANGTNLREINLQLAFLDEIKFLRTDAKNIILYVSNAIDPEYTTPKEFKTLVTSIFSAIGTTKTGYVIYHTGGGREAAIYKLIDENGFKNISVVCRDDLVWAPSYGGLRGKRYTTYFDVSKYAQEVTNNDAEYDYGKHEFKFEDCE